jgi:hypothetical protein
VMRRLLVVLFVAVSCIAISSVASSASAASAPRGAVVLKTSALKKAGTTQCGKVKGVWISGKVTKTKSKNYFVSHSKSAQLYLADAKKARGARKKKLQKLSSDFKKKASMGNKSCARFTAPVPTATTAPVMTSVPLKTPNSSTVTFNLTGASALAVLSTNVMSAGVRKAGASSNVRGIREDGSVFDAVESGTLVVRNVFIAPSDKIYMLLRSVAQIDGESCILLQVRKSDGRARCVEREQFFIQTNFSYNNKIEQYIQFDESGAIYYAGTPSPARMGSKGYFEGWQTQCRNQYGDTVENLIVRRWKDGVVTDFGYGAEPGKSTNQPEKLMFPESVFQHPSGQSVSGLQYVTDRCVGKFAVSTSGDVLLDQGLGQFMFPWNSGPSPVGFQTVHYDSDGVKRDVTPSSQKCNGVAVGFRCNQLNLLQVRSSDTAFVACASSYPNGTPIGGFCITNTRTGETGAMQVGEWWDPEVCRDAEENCSKPAGLNEPCLYSSIWSGARRITYMCGWGGSHWSHFWKTPTGRSYAVVGGSSFCVVYENNRCSSDVTNWEEVNRTGIVVEVEPRFRGTPLGGLPTGNILDNVEALVPTMGSVIASGPVVIEDGGRRPIQFKTVLYDLESGTTRDLIGIDRGLRIRKLRFSAALSKAFFVATQNSDGRQVVGSVDIGSGKISFLDSVLGNIEDLQAL